MEIGSYKKQFSAVSLEEKKAAIVRLESTAADLVKEKNLDEKKVLDLVKERNFLSYYKTSAKTGNGVYKAFQAIIKELYHKYKDT